jgi:hypothetical protein
MSSTADHVGSSHYVLQTEMFHLYDFSASVWPEVHINASV